MRLNVNTTSPKRVSPPSPGSDQQILDYVKKHRNEPEKIVQYVDNLAKQSPQTELHSNVSNTSSVFTVFTSRQDSLSRDFYSISFLFYFILCPHRHLPKFLRPFHY